MEHEKLRKLEQRLGRLHAHQRLGIEADHSASIFGQGLNFFHIENWYSIHSVIKSTLHLLGLYRRGVRNTHDIKLRHNIIQLEKLPRSFNGFRILHISDPHFDMSNEATHALIERVQNIEYDLCVFTGDYRAQTFGPSEQTLEYMRLVRNHLPHPVYAVLGNHDSIEMVPDIEDMGIRMLINESESIERGSDRIYLAGIDDAHYFRVDNIEKAADAIPHDAVSILLSHTPEIYRQAAHAAFDVLLCGHTHGGQICLPGGIPFTLDSNCPRYMGAGHWQYREMVGYTSAGAGTSVVNVRLNCPPEVTLHRLSRAE